jgi:hypothetical protein
MNQNPYAGGPYVGGGGTGGGPPPPPPGAATVTWTTSELVSASWEIFGKHAPVLIGANVVVALAVQLAQFPGVVVSALCAMAHVQPALVSGWMSPVMRGAISFPFVMLASAFFNVGIVRLALQAARGEDPQFGVVFSGLDRVLPMLGLNLVMGLGIVVGFILLVVPGVILSVAWSMAGYYMVDQNLGPIDALKASWEGTKGARAALALVFLAGMGILLVGMACCCIGMIAAIPLTTVLYAMTYLKLRGPTGPQMLNPYEVGGDWPEERIR